MANEPKESTKPFLRPAQYVNARYANNVQFDTSVFDLRMAFGELRRDPDGSSFVEQHSMITMSWMEAKAMALLLTLNVAAHEHETEPIRLHKAIVPPSLTVEEGALPITTLAELFVSRFVRDVEKKKAEAADGASEDA